MREHQVTIVFKLDHRQLRTPKALYSLHVLADRLAKIVLRHAVGRFIAHESSNSEFRLHFGGPNADRLFNLIQGPLFASWRSFGGYAIKRYGPPGLGHKEERVDFDAVKRGDAARAIKRRIDKEAR